MSAGRATGVGPGLDPDLAERAAELAAGGPVTHYSLRVRVHHAVLGVCVLVLTTTGFGLRVEALSFLAPWLGGPRAMGYAHRTAASVLGALFAHHLATVVLPHVGRTVRRVRAEHAGLRSRVAATWTGLRVLPDRGDLQDLEQTVRYYLGRAPHDHRAGRFHVRLKLHYLAVLGGMCTMGGTGLVLALPVDVAPAVARIVGGLGLDVTAASVVRFAELVHGEEALLVVVVSIVWHSYRMLFPLRRDMFTGQITLDELRHHHPAWLDELARAADRPRGGAAP